MAIKQTYKNGCFRRLLALLLGLFLAIPQLSLPAKAADDAPSAEMTNSYLLRLDTGINAGKQVLYLLVRYLDPDGVNRSQILFPHDNSLQEGFALADAAVSTIPVTTTDKEGVDQTAYTSRFRQLVSQVELNTYYDFFHWDQLEGLSSMGHDEYFFQPYYPIQKLQSVEVYQQAGENAKGWTCNQMQLFQVDRLYGVAMCGYYSTNYFVEFEGKLLYAQSKALDYTLPLSDQIYRVSLDGQGLYTMNDMGAAAYNNHDSSKFLFEVDIADTYMGGIEALATPVADESPVISKLPFLEMLNLKIKYSDTGGVTHTVQLPLISSALAWGLNAGTLLPNYHLIGLAQEGDNLIFEGNLPDLANLISAEISFDLDVDRQLGITRKGDIIRNNVTYDNAKDAYPDSLLLQDKLMISGIKIYTLSPEGLPASEMVTYSGENTFFYTVNALPTYYFTADHSVGITVQYGKSKSFALSSYTPGALLEPQRSLNATYLVQVTTDQMPSAATENPLYASLQYRASDGTEKNSPTVELTLAANDFYGYWPSTDGDYSYRYAVSPGTTMSFLVDISDVTEFTGVTFSMKNNGHSDDWQGTSVAIYKPSFIGKRTAVWQDHAVNGVSTDRIFSRAVTCGPVLQQYVATGEDGFLPIYIDGGSDDTASDHLGFETHTTDVTDDPLDWSNIRYSMTYKEAKQDLGFTTARATYVVDVQVAGNEFSNDVDGDCGSTNLFFFQLVFESGTSAFVLANQQLSADGFRAGQLESFTIRTNQDYGDVSSIRILPDDVSESDHRDVFDKLNIKYVSVTKKSESGLSLTWIAQNVGWIEIDYQDEAAKNGLSGQAGRTAEEIIREFPITSKGYSSNLLFEITTGSYAANFNQDGTEVPGSEIYPQLQGSITATIEYRDNDNIIHQQNLDIVSAMYDYDGKKPSFDDKLTYTGENDVQKACALLNPDLMARAGHTDRFIVSMLDVSEILSIELQVHGTVATAWKINSVSVYQINAAGKLQLNANDEYQRHTAAQVELLATDTEQENGNGYRIFVTHDGAEQKQVIDFTKNHIEITQEGDIWSSTITRTPVNRNDSVNIYVFPVSDEGMDSYQLIGDLHYYTSDNPVYMSLEVNPLDRYLATEEGERSMFYATGLSATGLSNITSLTLTSTVNAKIDYALVQRVRSGVVIETVYLDFNGKSAPVGGVMSKVADASQFRPLPAETQKVQLFFSEDTVNSLLTPESNDIAVALRYTSGNDLSGKEYQSAYIYLTDLKDASGNSIYSSIRPGMIAELTFQQSFISKITGITVASTGNLEATIDSAVVTQYRGSGASKQMTDWISLADSMPLTHSPQNMVPTTENVVPIEIRLTTAPAGETVSTGTDDPIRLTVSYTDQHDIVPQTLTIPDLRTYLVSGTFHSDDTATLRFFMKNLGKIRTLKLEPYSQDAYTTAIWGLKSIQLDLTDSGETRNIQRTLKEGSLIREGSPEVINLSDLQITAYAYYQNGETGASASAISYSNATEAPTALIASGDKVTVSTEITGTLPGYGIRAESYYQSEGSLIRVDYCTEQGASVIFTPPANQTENNKIYWIYLISEEVPGCKAVIQVQVQPEGSSPAPSAEPPQINPTTPVIPQQSDPQEDTPPQTQPTVPLPEDTTPRIIVPLP